MTTEEELRDKLKKLKESEALQEEKVKNANTSLEKARKKLSKENAKLESIKGEINRIDGYLFRNITLKFGIANFEELEAYLSKNKTNANENKGDLNKWK